MTYRSFYTTFYPEAIRGIIMLTYLWGLRPSETLGIEMSDMHLGTDNYIVIKQTKFNKTRIVTFNDKVVSFIEDFLFWRKHTGLPSESDSPLFLKRTFATYSTHALQMAFAMIRKEANVHRYDGAKYQPSHGYRTCATHFLLRELCHGIGKDETYKICFLFCWSYEHKHHGCLYVYD